jgi:hypothetical protein
MTDLLQILGAALAMAGAWCNMQPPSRHRLKSLSFILWLIANTLLIAYLACTLGTQAWPMQLMYAYYLVTSAIGLRNHPWRPATT